MTPSFTLRSYRPEDEEFIHQLYCTRRQKEMAMAQFTPEQAIAFLLQQSQAMHTHYQAHFSPEEHYVIELDGEPAGRIWTETRAEELRLLDVALLPKCRRLGIGKKLLADLTTRARELKLPVTLCVSSINEDAQRFYRSLGFQLVKADGPNLFLELPAG